MHFQNARKRRFRGDPEVAGRIKKIKTERKPKGENRKACANPEEDVGDAAARKKNNWSIPNFDPKPVTGEDETTLERHEKLLKVCVCT